MTYDPFGIGITSVLPSPAPPPRQSVPPAPYDPRRGPPPPKPPPPPNPYYGTDAPTTFGRAPAGQDPDLGFTIPDPYTQGFDPRQGPPPPKPTDIPAEVAQNQDFSGGQTAADALNAAELARIRGAGAGTGTVSPASGFPPRAVEQDPLPASWTPDSYTSAAPQTLPGRYPLPNRPPDEYWQGSPVWHLRPGEPGYNAGAAPITPFGQTGYPDWRSMSATQLANSNWRTPILQFVSGAESGNRNIPGTLPVDRAQGTSGYFQISDDTFRQFAPRAGVDPARYGNHAQNAPAQVQAAVAMQIPAGRWTAGWRAIQARYPWATRDMTLGQIAAKAGGTQAVTGQPERYMPPESRPSSQWGQDPDMQWQPGRMPMSHDIPAIMRVVGSFLPLLSLFAGRSATGMLTAYGAYMNGRLNQQHLNAQEQKTRWRDELAETVARMKEEELAAAGAFAGTSDPTQLTQELTEIATRFGDPQLLATLHQRGLQATHDLLDRRDQLYQTLAKTSAATTKAEQQQAATNAEIGAETSPYSATGPTATGAAPAVAPTAAAPAADPFASPALGTPPAAAPTPEAPSAPTTPSPAGATPTPPAGAPPGVTPIPPGGAPPSAAPPGATTAPVTEEPAALGPPELPPQLQQGVTGLSPERLDQDARQYLESQRPLYNPHTDPLGQVRNEAVARRASQMQAYVDGVIRNAQQAQRGTNPDDIFRQIDSVDPGMASIARAVDHGDMAPPSGWQLRTPLYQNVQKLVTAADPTWSATRWVTNYRTKVAYTTGTQSIQIASANRALQHMTVLKDAADQLHNSRFPDFNSWRNWAKTHTGSPVVTDFDIARAHVAQELERVFRGNSGAVQEINRDLETVGSSSSPEQIDGYIRTITDLLKGQLDSLADLYQRGTMHPTRGEDLLSPEARATYGRMLKIMPGTGGIPGPTSSADPAALDDTATPPPPSAYSPGPAPVELPPGVSEVQ